MRRHWRTRWRAGWARVRADAGTEEIRLGPLSPAEVAEQAAALAGAPVPRQLAGELFARAEGNPFFTEQLVAAALAGRAGGGLHVPAGLPARLAELLAARAGRCAGEARAVLAGLAVAGRSLAEELLAAVTDLDTKAVRRGLLAQIRTLAERARIPLHPAAAGEPEGPPPAQPLTRYGLTDRELTVLRLLATGRTNPQIGAELYISTSTASVHVSNILRKLGVSSRVQAAAIAERAGLLARRPP